MYMYRSNDSFHPFMPPPPSLVGVHRHKPQGVDDQWQRPEMSSNVAVELSLADTIDTLLLPSDIERRSKKWKDAHCKYDNVSIETKQLLSIHTCVYNYILF